VLPAQRKVHTFLQAFTIEPHFREINFRVVVQFMLIVLDIMIFIAAAGAFARLAPFGPKSSEIVLNQKDTLKCAVFTDTLPRVK
jgi:hypothetical protein